MTELDPIRTLVHSYADAVCRRDVEQWGANWTADATWDIGGGPSAGRDVIVRDWGTAMAGMRAVVHTVLNGDATLDGDTGTGRWYFQEHVAPFGSAPALLLAYYDDVYRCEDGHWRFASRLMTLLYLGPPDLSGHFGLAIQPPAP
jgi:hypothetical protein